MADVPDRLLPASQPAASGAARANLPIAKPLSRSLLIMLTCGVACKALFPIIYVIEGKTRPGYDAWRQSISSLSLGPGGWIQQLDFVVCGVSILWLAFVWRKILAGGVCATWYPIIRGIEGVGLIAIAIFSQDPGYGYPPGTPSGPGPSTLGGTLHLVFTILVVNAMTFGLFVIARRFCKHPLCRCLPAFSVACGLLTMLCMSFFGVAQNTHSVFAGYAGLFERLATNADTIWSLVLVARLWVRRSTGI